MLEAVEPTNRAQDAEALLAESGWLRRLARRLARDPALADDVVQDTWLAALERGSQPRDARGLRGWLATVARNLALRAGRREAARPGIERAAARREAVEGGQEAVERVQLQRLLADAILVLGEPYRSAVILRHLDGLSSTEIARVQGCTRVAARQRVARGLALLRAELDRRSGGDRGMWCAAFAAAFELWRPAAPAASAAGAAGLVGGGIVGSKAIAIVAGVTLAAGAFLWSEGHEHTGATAAAGLEPARAAASLPSPTVPAPALGSSEPDAPLSDRRAIAPQGAGAASDERALAGRVVDEAGRALQGAIVYLPPPGCEEGAPSVHDETGEDGCFRLLLGSLPEEARNEQRFALRVERDGFVPARIEGSPDAQLEVVLIARPVVSGRLLDPAGCVVGPRGTVSLSVIDEQGDRHESGAELDEDGTWTTGDLVPGRLVNIRGRAKGFAAGGRELDLLLAPGAREVLDVTLEVGARLSGVVVDAVSGEPVPFADVWSESWHLDLDSVEPTARADAGGRFVLVGVDPDQVQDVEGQPDYVLVRVSAQAEGYAGRPFNLALGRRLSNGSCLVRVEIQPAQASLSGTIEWTDGTPAAGLLVHSIDAQHNLGFQTTDAEGRFHIAGLPAGSIHLLARPMEGFPGQRRGSVRADFELAPGESRTAELVALDGADGVLAGRVIDLEGDPLAGIAVFVGDNWAVPDMTLGIGHQAAVTDESGRFRLEALYPGRYQLELRAPEGSGLAARPSRHEIDLEPGARADSLEFVLAPAIAISGWVDPGTRPLDGLEIELRTAADGGRQSSSAPQPDGSFAFAGLYPDRYEVVLVEAEQELARAAVGPLGSAGVMLVAPR